jgi:hypothetical protein
MICAKNSENVARCPAKQLSIERHQRLHMPAADLVPLQSQQASQHPRTGEGILQVKPTETLHDPEVADDTGRGR